MPRRRLLLVALAAILLTGTGCQSSDPPNTPATDASASCNHGPDTGAGDPGLGAGFDYVESHHELGTAAPLTLCMNIGRGSVRLVGTSPHITVEPETLPEVTSDRYTFTVTVAPGADGDLEVDLLNDRGEQSGHFNGPRFTTDDTGWAFQP